MKTTRLFIDYDYPFELIAVVSPVKEYKLAWTLNKSLNLYLVKAPDLKYDFINNSIFFISNFIFEKEYSSFRLLKNRACEFENVAKPFLLPELKEYDYIILLQSEGEAWNVDEIEGKMKKLPVVQFCKKVDIHDLKSKENLIFE